MSGISNDWEKHIYQEGHFYFGERNAIDHDGVIFTAPLGVASEKHAITIGSARTGKGIGVIIPNLLRWSGSALVVDPKGEAAEATAEHREKMGQKVYVFDPFKVAKKIPDRMRKRFNPLGNLDPNSLRIREDINVLADGLLMRHDPRGGHWDGGGLSVIAGLLVHVLTGNHNHPRTLATMREFINGDSASFGGIVEQMQENPACGRLAQVAASKLTKTGNEAGHFLSVADENTKWLDSDPMRNLLSANDCDLSELKTSKTTIYLVLPVDLLDEHGRFLRLFVRSAISAMAQQMPDGSLKGERCLFLLDEFHALGHINEVAKSAGLMPGFGLHLWPFLQNIGQLTELYGRDGAHTFFGSADLHQFFGSADMPTLEYISSVIGNISEEDYIPHKKHEEDIIKWHDTFEERKVKNRRDLSRLENNLDHHRTMLGRPRKSPSELSVKLAKTDKPVAEYSLNIIKGHIKIFARVWAYFWKDEIKPERLTKEENDFYQNHRLKNQLDNNQNSAFDNGKVLGKWMRGIFSNRR